MLWADGWAEGEGLGMDVRGRVKTEGFIKPVALRDGCKGGVKV